MHEMCQFCARRACRKWPITGRSQKVIFITMQMRTSSKTWNLQRLPMINIKSLKYFGEQKQLKTDLSYRLDVYNHHYNPQRWTSFCTYYIHAYYLHLLLKISYATCKTCMQSWIVSSLQQSSGIACFPHLLNSILLNKKSTYLCTIQ